MKRLSITQKLEALQNSLVSFKFSEKYFIHVADKRCGQRFALATHSAHGGISIHSEFMTYDEFNCYFKGWHDATIKKFNSTLKPNNKKIPYLSAEYFDEIIYRIENTDGHVYIGVEDEKAWMLAFKKIKPYIESITLTRVNKGNIYTVSANI